MMPEFGLEDIPPDFWIELRQDFVDELDELNRPWKYGKLNGRKIAAYWESGELHSRTKSKMSPEELDGYKRRISLFEKLWGRHRFKDYHYAENDPRRYVNTGSWILKTEIKVLREGIEITDSELEKAIVGIRRGKGNDKMCRELRFPRLPIVADRWWAWLIGIYFSSGNIYSYFGLNSRTRGSRGPQRRDIRIRVHDEVQPKLMEVSTHIGAPALLYPAAAQNPNSKYEDKNVKKLGAGQRSSITYGWPTYLVLEKFGVPMDWLELGTRKHMSHASRGYKPRVPEWIKENDAFMKYFIEGYLSGGQGHSFLSTAKSLNQRSRPNCHIGFNLTGKPEEMVHTFLTDIKEYLDKKGLVSNKIRNIVYNRKDPARVKLQLNYTNYNAIKWFSENIHLTRNDVRSRCTLYTDAKDDIVLYEALRQLKSYEAVLLGTFYEQPKTKGDIEFQMHPDHVALGIHQLHAYGLIEYEGDLIVYNPTRFITKTQEKYEWEATITQNTINEYMKHLLYQCQTCLHVYTSATDKCHYCGNYVDPVPREKIIKPLEIDRRYSLYHAHLLRIMGNYEKGIPWRNDNEC